jgi:hypothetical protein
MKLWIDLCALCLSLGKIDHGFSPRSEVGAVKKPCCFGSFSVRPVSAAAKDTFTFCTDQNLVFKFQETWSEYAELNALKAVWSRNTATKNTL